MELTPNQLVAFNLTRARQVKGWTQTVAAKMLTAVGPSGWTKITLSAAERSVDGQRVRQFTLDDITQFSATFGLPLIWWSLPPGPHEDPGIVLGSMRYTDVTWLLFCFGELDHPAVAERMAAPQAHSYIARIASALDWPRLRELADNLRTAAGVMETAAVMAAPPPVRRPSPISRDKSKKAGKPATNKERRQ